MVRARSPIVAIPIALNPFEYLEAQIGPPRSLKNALMGVESVNSKGIASPIPFPAGPGTSFGCGSITGGTGNGLGHGFVHLLHNGLPSLFKEDMEVVNLPKVRIQWNQVTFAIALFVANNLALLVANNLTENPVTQLLGAFLARFVSESNSWKFPIEFTSFQVNGAPSPNWLSLASRRDRGWMWSMLPPAWDIMLIDEIKQEISIKVFKGLRIDHGCEGQRVACIDRKDLRCREDGVLVCLEDTENLANAGQIGNPAPTSTENAVEQGKV